jgi:hypothetical protein
MCLYVWDLTVVESMKLSRWLRNSRVEWPGICTGIGG